MKDESKITLQFVQQGKQILIISNQPGKQTVRIIADTANSAPTQDSLAVKKEAVNG